MSANASSFGLGAVLKQKQHSGGLRPVAYDSGLMTTTSVDMHKLKKKHWQSPGHLSIGQIYWLE